MGSEQQGSVWSSQEHGVRAQGVSRTWAPSDDEDRMGLMAGIGMWRLSGVLTGLEVTVMRLYKTKGNF